MPEAEVIRHGPPDGGHEASYVRSVADSSSTRYACPARTHVTSA